MPFPSFAFLEQLTEPLTRILKKYGLAVNSYLQIQHKDDGSHSAITGDSLSVTGTVTATGTGQSTFGGDVIAQSGTGNESGIGALTTINGVAFLAGYPSHHALLIGGVTSGYASMKKTKGGAFGGAGTFSWALIDMANSPTVAPMLEMALDNGNYSILDGGTGSTRINLGNSLRPMLAVYADSHNDANGTFGTWTDIAFNAANFTASTGNWTLTAPDQVQYRWMMIGHTLFLKFRFDTTSVSAGTAQLRVALPFGFTALKDGFAGGIIYNDNGAGWNGDGHAYSTAGVGYVEFHTATLANWTIAANTTSVWGHVVVEV